MFSMEDTIKSITKLLKISKDLQFEVTIEENTIHDLEFAKTLQRLKREIKFPTKLEDPTTDSNPMYSKFSRGPNNFDRSSSTK